MPLGFPVGAVPVDPRTVPVFLSSFNGVDPSGATDSSAAFNAALAFVGANGSLIIGPGTYLIGAVAINAIPGNCSFIGAGEFSTTITTAAASGNLFTLTNAGATFANLSLTNTNAANAATAISMAANQVSVYNVTVTGFLNGIVMTAAATLGNVFNTLVSSTVAGSTGVTVAGADTLISGAVFNSSGQLTGLVCNANDRFAVTDCTFKSCLVGASLTNTSATGSSSFSGFTMDACTTGIAVTPGTGQSVQNVALVGFTIDGATTGISVAPTGSGTVVGVDFDGVLLSDTTGISVAPAGTSTIQGFDFDGLINACTTGINLGGSSTGAITDVDVDAVMINYTTGVLVNPSAGPVTQAVLGECVFDSTTASSIAVSVAPTATGTVDQWGIDGCVFRSSQATGQGIVFNGAASSIGTFLVDGCNFKGITAAGNALVHTAGATTANPIQVVNSSFSTSVNGISPNLGSANTLVWAVRGCNGSGVSSVGKTTSQPAVASMQNFMGGDIQAVIQVGGTATNFTIGGQNIFAAGVTATNFVARLTVGTTIVPSQATAVTWIFFMD